MIKLRFRLLGEPEIWYGPTRLHTLLSRKQLALLIFLVCEGTVFRRERLATLLWGECGQSQALYNLRRALYQIGHELCLIDLDRWQFLIVSPYDVQWYPKAPYSLDIRESDEPSRGPFLGTFTVNNAPEFEEWVTMQRAAIDVQRDARRQPEDACKLLMGRYYVGPTGQRFRLMYALADNPVTLVLQRGGRYSSLSDHLFRGWFTLSNANTQPIDSGTPHVVY